jgi:hypothetical protein
MSTTIGCEFSRTHLVSELLFTNGRTEILMTCRAFQDSLAYVMDNHWPEEMNLHLHSCPQCAEVVADIRYIVHQVQLLMPLLESSPLVWRQIREKLDVGRNPAG